jgi:rhamnogalacturonyl hydrolase YesR
MDIVDGLYSTVPTLISFGVMVGKMAPVQNVVLAFMNVMAYVRYLLIQIVSTCC